MNCFVVVFLNSFICYLYITLTFFIYSSCFFDVITIYIYISFYIYFSPSAGVIAGAVIGGIVGLIIICAIVGWVCVRICQSHNHGQVLVYPQQPAIYTSSSTSLYSLKKYNKNPSII